MPDIGGVIPGGYSTRIAYNTALLAANQYWFQTDDGPSAPGGFYYWDGTAWQPGSTPATGQLIISSLSVLIQALQAGGAVGLQGNGGGTQASDSVAGEAIFNIENAYPTGLREAELRFKLVGAANEAIYSIFAEASTNPVTDQNLSFKDLLNNVVVISLGRAAQFQMFTGIEMRGILTPAQITADQNDYAPGSVQTYSVFRISSDAARNITGLAITASLTNSGALVNLLNVGAFAITLKNASGLSLAANRFALKADLAIAANGGAILWYDVASTSWRCLATY